MIVYFKCLVFCFVIYFLHFFKKFYWVFRQVGGHKHAGKLYFMPWYKKSLIYNCLKSNPMSVLWCKNIRVSLMECVSVRAVCPALSYTGVQSQSWLPKHITISFSLTRSATQTVICMCCQHLQTVCLMWETTVSWSMNCMPMASKHIL